MNGGITEMRCLLKVEVGAKRIQNQDSSMRSLLKVEVGAKRIQNQDSSFC